MRLHMLLRSTYDRDEPGTPCPIKKRGEAGLDCLAKGPAAEQS